jgi:hypothetical protein
MSRPNVNAPLGRLLHCASSPTPSRVVSLVSPRSMVNKSAQPCAGRENLHEIPLFTLNARQRKRHHPIEYNFVHAARVGSEVVRVRETFGSILPSTPSQSSTGFVESSIDGHHTKEVFENDDSWGFVPHTLPLSFGLGHKRDETRFAALDCR